MRIQDYKREPPYKVAAEKSARWFEEVVYNNFFFAFVEDKLEKVNNVLEDFAWHHNVYLRRIRRLPHVVFVVCISFLVTLICLPKFIHNYVVCRRERSLANRTNDE